MHPLWIWNCRISHNIKKYIEFRRRRVLERPNSFRRRVWISTPRSAGGWRIGWSPEYARLPRVPTRCRRPTVAIQITPRAINTSRSYSLTNSTYCQWCANCLHLEWRRNWVCVIRLSFRDETTENRGSAFLVSRGSKEKMKIAGFKMLRSH